MEINQKRVVFFVIRYAWFYERALAQRLKGVQGTGMIRCDSHSGYGKNGWKVD